MSTFPFPEAESDANDPNERAAIPELSRWAELVATGQARFPTGLSSDAHRRFVAEVQRHRRSRVVQFIARAIAQDILHHRDHQQGG